MRNKAQIGRLLMQLYVYGITRVMLVMCVRVNRNYWYIVVIGNPLIYHIKYILLGAGVFGFRFEPQVHLKVQIIPHVVVRLDVLRETWCERDWRQGF